MSEQETSSDRVDENQYPLERSGIIKSNIFVPARRAKRFRSTSSHHRAIQLPYRGIRSTFRTAHITPSTPQRLKYHSIPKYNQHRKGIDPSIAKAIGTALGFLVIENLLPKVDGEICNGTVPFTTNLLANPHCDEHMSMASLFIPLFIFLGIIACVARLLRSEHKARSISTFIRTRTKLENQKRQIPLDEIEIENGNTIQDDEIETAKTSIDKEENETKKRFLKLPNYMNLGSRISLTILLVMMIGKNIEACDDAHIVHTTSFKCVNLTNCYQEYDNQMILSKGTHKACISMKFKNTTVGIIEIEKSRTEYRCIKNLKYFTRQTRPKITTIRRCSSFGSCDNTCMTINPRTKIPEFKEHQEGPFQIGCQNSCGFLACGCITWSDSCTFYLIEHIASSDEIYEAFVCDLWEPIVHLKIIANIFNQKTEMNLTLKPYEKYTHPFFNMSIISQINIQSALHNKLFLVSNQTSFSVDRHETPTVSCESEHQAVHNFSQCSVSKFCHCNVNKDYEVACDCPSPEIYRLENQLPLNVEEMSIEQSDKQIKLYPKNDETTIALDSAILMNPSSFYFDYPCKADVIEVTGCYSCLKGASVKIECLTSIKSNVLLVCSSQTFSITCSPSAEINTIILHWETSILSESCYLTCSGERKELKIRGNLHWKPDIPYPSWVNKNDHTRQMRPDYTPLWEVILSNWKHVFCYLLGTFIISISCYTFGLTLSLLFIKWTLKGFFNFKENLLKFYHSWKTALKNDSMA
ncbi:unnamed protein product [Auanema sp. JU1783]|nr:unnamed protein product [Auanema sp. JU1783]